MTQYKLTNKAVEDLNDIWEYTANKWSEEQADKDNNMLLASFQNIANSLDLGRNYDGIATDLFVIKSNLQIIFYRIEKNKPIELTRISHESVDLKKQNNRIKHTPNCT